MIFGERLRAARAMAGLSQADLSARMDGSVTKQAISKYEKGLMMPETSTTLIALSDALAVPVDYFFRTVSREPLELYYRKRASIGAKAENALIEKVRDMLERYQELEELLGTHSKFEIPSGKLDLSTSDGAQASAKAVRQNWGVGSEQPVPSVTRLCEDKGLRLVGLEGVPGFDGMAGDYAGRPFVAISPDLPNDRIRFTLLHKLAHILGWRKDRGRLGHNDKSWHAFASEFLLPEEVLRRELSERVRRSIAIPELLQLKEKFGISMQAILFRANAAGILTASGYRAILRQFGARGWRKDEPGSVPGTEKPLRFERLLFRAIAEDAISMSKAASLSLVSLDELRRRLRGDDAARD
jgi:Zn-dependent peptidase ImmA (M78 family)/transcriptional regulator with XRE-family HTH domain